MHIFRELMKDDDIVWENIALGTVENKKRMTRKKWVEGIYAKCEGKMEFNIALNKFEGIYK